MPKSIQGFVMAGLTTLIVIAIATRFEPLAKLAGLPPAPK